MSAQYLESLPWLARPPADFRERCRWLDETAGDASTALCLLGAAALNADQLIRLGKSLTRIAASGRPTSALADFRLAVLGNGTTDLLAAALAGSALRHGVRLTVIAADYDQLMQEALDPASRINSSRPDAVLLALDHRALSLGSATPDDGSATLAVMTAMIDGIRQGIAHGAGAPVIYQTVAPPIPALFGHLDRRVRYSASNFVAGFNDHLASRADERGDYLLDVAALAAEVGLERWQDPGQWNLFKLPFAQKFVPLYADHVGRLLGAIRGKARKCLVLDLDNTLWGGVIGDDGLAGIVVGQGDGRGEAFVDLQRVALALRQRGVILAVCSKNDEMVAREPFRRHPDMILKEEHFAIFQANWNDKASNLRSIAAALDIGLDSLVFVDDNPAERLQVRLELPMVAVPELPDDPSYYARYLLSAGYFETVTYNEADRQRAQQYEGNARRAELAATSSGIDSFLSALEMTIAFHPFQSMTFDRVTQLINKTNQFNLTTRRYTRAQVCAMADDEGLYTLQVRLKDRFGDNGIIAAIICRAVDDSWVIDTWLMSCRVLKRRVEEAMLEKLRQAARRRGISKLVGHYIPTEKNGMVRLHYQSLGFTPAGAASHDGLQIWEKAVADQPSGSLPFVVDDSAP